MFKYNQSRGVSGTPTAAVNGIKLEVTPPSSEEWLILLQDVLDE